MLVRSDGAAKRKHPSVVYDWHCNPTQRHTRVVRAGRFRTDTNLGARLIRAVLGCALLPIVLWVARDFVRHLVHPRVPCWCQGVHVWGQGSHTARRMRT